MSRYLAIGAAVLALSAFASVAQARMPGGPAAPTSLSRADTRLPSSIGSMRTFSTDSRMISPDGLQLRVRGGHWKKPIDSDQGGAEDPPKKTPKDPQTSQTGGGSNGGIYWAPRYHPHHGPGVQDYGSSNGGLPLACKGRPGGC